MVIASPERWLCSQTPFWSLPDLHQRVQKLDSAFERLQHFLVHDFLNVLIWVGQQLALDAGAPVARVKRVAAEERVLFSVALAACVTRPLVDCPELTETRMRGTVYRCVSKRPAVVLSENVI